VTIIVDTCLLVDALNEKRGRKEFLLNLILQGHKLASCAITIAEVYAGMRPAEADDTERSIAGLEYFPTTENTARLGGELKERWARKGKTLALTDTLIAAVAIENGLTVATDNVKDFPMPELRLLTPPRPH
jgi:predicted nucleic acid-binding protein